MLIWLVLESLHIRLIDETQAKGVVFYQYCQKNQQSHENTYIENTILFFIPVNIAH